MHVAKRPPEDGADFDDRVLAVLLMLLGLMRVVPAIWLGEGFGAEATVAIMMVTAGLAILVGDRGGPRKSLPRS